VEWPRFSIMIPAYNAERTLCDTLDSLLSQALTDWEVIVVDDGSVDATCGIAQEYAARDGRIRARSQDNAGAAAARNVAAQLAGADWLLSLDADDLLLPVALEHQAAFMDAYPGFDIYSWNVLLQHLDGSRTPWSVSADHDAVESFSLDQLVDRNMLTVMTFVSREFFERIGGFRDVELEDYDFWLRAFAAGARHLPNPEYLAVYRVNAESRNADASGRAAAAAKVLEDLLAGSELPEATLGLVVTQQRYCEAMPARIDLERRLSARQYEGARGRYLRARSAYRSSARWTVGLAVMTLSPALFARLFHREAPDSTNV
jgi:cellulose synthase/poly-beta-1,6-N-acetylglucosamine synthase-like glycosyltransferase